MLRRRQILLVSVRGFHITTIERNLGCDDDTVRKVIKAFNAHGLAALKAKSRRPTTLARRLLLSQASGSKKSCTKARVRTAKIPACGPWN